jgi:5-formyltetrahydrofolate cyclo-ligase
MSRMSSTIAKEKHQFRRALRALRASLLPEDVADRSAIIWERLRATREYRHAQALHTYVSAIPGEVETRRAIARALRDGLVVAVPIADWATRRLRSVRLQGLEELRPASRGLLEPPLDSAEPFEPDVETLIVAPALAVDPAGNRLGLGGAYYDRFLASVPCTTAAVCFECQLVEALPTEPHDVPVHLIVTEERILHPHA